MGELVQKSLLEVSRVCETGRKNIEKLTPLGVTQGYIENVEKSNSEAMKLENEYESATIDSRELTRRVEDLIEKIKMGVYSIKNIVKFRVNDAKIKDSFLLNSRTKESLAGVIDEAGKIVESALKYRSILESFDLQSGYIDQLKSNFDELLKIDNKQELSKKELKLLRLKRDEKIDEAVQGKRFIQKMARVAFHDNPEIKESFFKFESKSSSKPATNDGSNTQTPTNG